MLKQSVFPALLLAFAASASADRSVSLTFPNANAREVWVASASAGGSPPPDAKAVVAASTSVNVPGVDPNASLYVLDRTSGNLAVYPVRRLGATLTVAAADFRRVASVRVRVISGSDPVAAAQVTLKAGTTVREDFIDPSSQGELRFHDLPTGRVEVSARVKIGGADQEVTQLFDLPAKRPEPEPVLTVLVPAGVQAAAPPEPAATEAVKQRSDEKGSGAVPASGLGGNLLSTIIGFLLFAGFLAAAVVLFRKNPKVLQEKLEQLGAQVPPAGQDPADDGAPTPVAPAAPAPVQKIVLGDAAPEPLGIPTAAPVAPIVSSGMGSPALLSEAGDEIPLDEGECVVGREAGLGLSLVGESTVSRRHARLIRDGGQVTLIDERSTNGTFVNGRPIDQPTTLQNGDRVQFGTVAFRYRG